MRIPGGYPTARAGNARGPDREDGRVSDFPLVAGTRPRKRWRYVGLYGPELSLCAAWVEVGPVRQSFWAVWDRAAGRLHERTRRGPRSDVRLSDGRLQLAAPGLRMDLRLRPDGAPIALTSPHGDKVIWTAKLPLVADGVVELAGARRGLEGWRGLQDDSAGHHARRTAWRWSAGAGVLADGRRATWNLVDGLHDAEDRSERHVWVDGVPEHVPPATFAADLSEVRAGAAVDLRCAVEATRARDEGVGPLVRSAYEQPFGTFTGTLGPGRELVQAHGVMERHTARW